MPRLSRTLPLVLAGSACAAPGDVDPPATDPTDPTTTGADAPAVTYTEHVRPILARRCVACHRAGSIAPLALDAYATAAAFAGPIADVTAARTMPPFSADNSGACGTYRDAAWLTDDELATLAAWAADGAPEGPPAPAPAPTPPPSLTGERLRVAMDADYVPDATRPDDYRCFVVAGAPADAGAMYVTGFDVHPGDPAVVHHVIVYTPKSDAAVAQVRALDDAEPGPGYTCFGTAQVPAAVAAAWAPGGGATHYPPGTGVALKPGAPLVLQLHYNTLAGAGPDRTAVDLEVRRDGVTPARFLGLADLGLALPPGQAEAEAGVTVRVGDSGKVDGPVTLLGLFPHMHTLGRTLELSRAGDGCLHRLPRWDFHWQRLYFYEDPPALDPDDTLTMRCTYDTRTRDETTRWGEGTLDEMCVAGLLVVDR